jgi:hypothetical protein
MNNDLLELWGRWALAASKSQQQLTTMSGMLKGGMQLMEELGNTYLQLWAGPAAPSAGHKKSKPDQSLWEPMLQMQQQWIQMLTGGAGSSELAKKVADLEQQVAAQAQLLELMKARLNIETAEQEEDFTRKFKELIERQNQQFEQLTSSFSDFFKKQGTAEEKDEKK